jgi:Na+/phosphate symporter
MSTTSPILVPESLRSDVHTMCAQAVEMLRLVAEAFRRQDTAPLAPAEALGREIHRREKALLELARGGPDDVLVVPMHVERIGDHIELLARAVRTMVEQGIPFSERAMREVSTLFDKALELLECVRDIVPTGNRVLIRWVLEQGHALEALAEDYALVHQQRLIEGVCMPHASSMYLALLDYLKGVESHARQIARKVSGQVRVG